MVQMLSQVLQKTSEILSTLPKAETDHFLASRTLPYPVQKQLEKFLEKGEAILAKAAGYSIVGKRALALITDRDLYSNTSILKSLSFTGIRGGLTAVVLELFEDIRFFTEKIHTPCIDYDPRKPLTSYVNKALEYSEASELPFILRIPLYSPAHAETETEHVERVSPRPYFNKHWLRPYRWNIIASRTLPKCIEDHKRNIKVLEELCEELELNQLEEKDPKKVAIVSASCSREAPEDETTLILAFMNPLPKKTIEELTAKAEKITIVDSGRLYLKEKIRSDKATVRKVEKKYEKTCGGCPFPYLLYAIAKALDEINEVGVVCTDTNCHVITLSTQQDFPENYQIKSISFFQRDFRDIIDIVLSENSAIDIARAIAEAGYQDGPVIAVTDLYRVTQAGKLPPNLYILAVNTLGAKHGYRKLPSKLDDLIEYLAKIFEAEESHIAVLDKPCPLAVKIDNNIELKIDEELCDKCGECLKILCEAISLEAGKIVLKEEYCRKCGHCAEICSRNAIVALSP